MQDLYEYLQACKISQQEISQKLIKILNRYDPNSAINLETYLLQELSRLKSSRPNQFVANLVKGGILGCAVAIVLTHTKLDGIVRDRLPDLDFIKTHLLPNK